MSAKFNYQLLFNFLCQKQLSLQVVLQMIQVDQKTKFHKVNKYFLETFCAWKVVSFDPVSRGVRFPLFS